MSADFYKQVGGAGSRKVKRVSREQAIRLYCEQSGETWILQVRGPEWLGSGRTEGKAFMVATAYLSKDDLLALRGAIDVLLKESE